MKNICRFLACTLTICILLSCTSNSDDNSKVDYLPQTPSISKQVDCFSVNGVDAGCRLAVLSLQGLVNRDGGKIYTHNGIDRWILDMYMEYGYIEDTVIYKDPFQLLAKYKSYIDGAIVYNPEKRHTVNLATNIAGVENRVIISPEMVEQFKAVTGITNITDLSQGDFDDQRVAFSWYREHIYPKQNNSVLVLGQGLSPAYDINRDYAVEFCLPSFWLPGKNDEDYDPEYEVEILDFLDKAPINIPILGFWPGADNNGKRIGYDEFDGVQLAGYYGKFTLVSDIVGNYSFHTGVRTDRTNYKQTLPRQKKVREYDPSKKYVALIMNESGDAPCYFMYAGFYPRQWRDPERGDVAISYGITPSLRLLAPGILNDIYNTQTANDYFFCSISGAGYCYPFEGYCSRTADRAANLTEYFSTITAKNMAIMDIDRLGIYTHSQNNWSEDDYRIARDYIVPMPGLKGIVSGMHRMQYTAANSHEMLEDISVHHTVTFWSMADFAWNDLSKDEISVDHLVNEIKTSGADGQFIQAMFYSWHYGPRRLNQLQKRLEPEGYEFVTIDEFDALWRRSLATK